MKIFEPEIKDEKCKHEWKRMHLKYRGGAHVLASSLELDFDYFLCPKCGSTMGCEIKTKTFF